MQRSHEPAGVVVIFLPRTCRSHQNDVRFQSLNFALDVVHPAKRENLMAAESNQVGQRASLRVHLP